MNEGVYLCFLLAIVFIKPQVNSLDDFGTVLDLA